MVSARLTAFTREVGHTPSVTPGRSSATWYIAPSTVGSTDAVNWTRSSRRVSEGMSVAGDPKGEMDGRATVPSSDQGVMGRFG